ncbi:MAG: SPOR domain-containing protein [Rhodospirillaceae bacterium]|nr:SPOR domain-containing protein [Rhodospirillaceae bacterium]
MTTEPPRPDQIQANVAAALSRLRGELAPTPPSAPAPGHAPAPEPQQVAREPEPILTAPEPLFDVGPGLEAPDPSMALNQGKSGGDMLDTPFARMTGLKSTEQPDLLAGIGTTPPPLADLPDADAEAAHRKRRLRNRLLAGGVLVIALAGFWYLSGGGDDSNEPIPVVTAEATPEKVKPADEGGLDVPNQDVAILNGENSAAPVEGETVLPAPEQPATPPVVPEPEVPAVTAPAAETTIPTVTAPAVDAIPTVPAPTDTAAVDNAGTVPATDPAAAPASEDTTPAVAEPAPVAEVPVAETAPTQTATAEPGVSGNARIQLAAVKTEEAAKTEWARLQKLHPDVLGGLSLHVERFEKSASEVFFRIQAGPFQDKAAAKEVCGQLKQKNQACIVAT